MLAVFLLCSLRPAAMAQSAPAHIATWMYYGLNDVNVRVAASSMVEAADVVEGSQYNLDDLQRFRAAGGKRTALYVDPSFVPYCKPPFRPPAGGCEGPFSTAQLPENAWLHDASGSRISRQYGRFQYQEALDPRSPQARNVIRRHVERLADAFPGLTYYLADDTGSSLRGHDGTPGTGAFYGWNAPPADLSDDSYAAGVSALIDVFNRPIVMNGNDVATFQPAYDSRFLRQRNVAGQDLEACFVGDHPVSNDGEKWRKEADSLLAVTAEKKLALCMALGDETNTSQRLYGFASWLLTYDPTYSMIAELGPTPDKSTLFPEFRLVPREPRETAQRSIETLRSAAGAYVRTFARCYERGKSLGSCAVIVNPSPDASVSAAALGRDYRATAELSREDETHGGRIHWRRGVPSQLRPLSAAIVRSSDI